MYYHKSEKDDISVIEVLLDLAFKLPKYGFRKLFTYIRRSGNDWKDKKVYRVYKLMKLNRKRKEKQKLPSRVKQSLINQVQINQSWSMFF
jgi:putative transposase